MFLVQTSLQNCKNASQRDSNFFSITDDLFPEEVKESFDQKCNIKIKLPVKHFDWHTGTGMLILNFFSFFNDTNRKWRYCGKVFTWTLLARECFVEAKCKTFNFQACKIYVIKILMV